MPVPKPANSAPASRWSPPGAAPPPGAPRSDGTPRVAPGAYWLTRTASVQFTKPIMVRVIRELTDRPTYYGWAWISCYQLDKRGEAIERRELFVMPGGMRRMNDPAQRRTSPQRNVRAAR